MLCACIGELHVAVAAEGVEGGFTRLHEVRPRAAVAVDARYNAGMVDVVVMADDAIHAGMIFVGKEDGRQARSRSGLQQQPAGSWNGKQGNDHDGGSGAHAPDRSRP